MGTAPSGNPEAFRERPGESMGGGMGMGAIGMLTDISEAVMPGVGLSGLMRMFGGEMSQPAPLAAPGIYTLTLTVGDRTFTQPITIERKGTFEGENSPFELSEMH